MAANSAAVCGALTHSVHSGVYGSTVAAKQVSLTYNDHG